MPENQDSYALAELAAKAALDKLAYDVIIVDLRDHNTFTDFFVICSANSEIHLESICRGIEDELEKYGVRLYHREGPPKTSWIVLDYIDVVVHVFLEEAREFYQIERLWADSPMIELGGEPPEEREPEEIPLEFDIEELIGEFEEE
ncbi:TPA: ribosome silencing factor [Candidatus Poribacteria bacterium]|nr:ribosome silencing factor [Candidatus Poribacteria bacterium]HEX29439.1 ribosome silencing factor [Candidatus Poribacteria bacterium]